MKVNPKYKIQLNVYPIGGHIVMTQAKVGTSTCTAIVFNKLKGEYAESNPEYIKTSGGPAGTLEGGQLYQRIRELSTYDVFDKDGKIQIQHLSDSENIASKDVEAFHQPIDKIEEKLIKDTVSTFENIVNGKSNKKIYILFREPVEQWKSAILEDLKFCLHQIPVSEMVERFRPSFIGTKFEKHHLQLLLDYENDRISSELGAPLYSAKGVPKKHKGTFQIEHLYFYMRERYLKAMVLNGAEIKWTGELYNEFKETYFEALWWQVIDPFKSVDGVHKTSNKVILYNMISTHYHPYLTKIWLLFSKVYYPEYIKFVDINNNFGLIKRIGNVKDMSNTKDRNVKQAWVKAFYNISRENNFPHLVYLEGEQTVYHTIKDYNKR